MTRLTQLHECIVPGTPMTEAPAERDDTTRVAATRAAQHVLISGTTTTITLRGQPDGSQTELLAQTYGELLSPSDIAAIRSAGPGEFLTIVGTEAHQCGGPGTDQHDPPCVWPAPATEEA